MLGLSSTGIGTLGRPHLAGAYPLKSPAPVVCPYDPLV